LKPISVELSTFPTDLQLLLNGASVYDTSGCSGASTIFIDRDNGYFLKSASKGELEREVTMTRYFYGKGLATEVLSYISDERDWMLTAKLHGDDGSTAMYIEQPERLCDIFAERLVMLHSEGTEGCPISNATEHYIASAKRNFQMGTYDKSHFPDSWGYSSATEAMNVIEAHGHLLETNTLLHGDYCLPNIILNNWQFSGFIDLLYGGVGDRHFDIFSATKTLARNLHTNKYQDRFFDAYGRNKIDRDRLRVVAALEVFM